MENRKELLAIDYLKTKLGTQKNVPKDWFEKLSDEEKQNYKVLKEVKAMGQSGKEVECYKVLQLPNDEEFEKIAVVCEANKLTANDLISGKYYIAPFGGKSNIFKKYTTIVADFKKTYKDFYVIHKELENGVVCYVKKMGDDGLLHDFLESFCSFEEAKKTQRPKIDFCKSKSFKDILRYNFPSFVEMYDEYDEDVINTPSQKNEESEAMKDDLNKMLREQLGEENV